MIYNHIEIKTLEFFFNFLKDLVIFSRIWAKYVDYPPQNCTNIFDWSFLKLLSHQKFYRNWLSTSSSVLWGYFLSADSKFISLSLIWFRLVCVFLVPFLYFLQHLISLAGTFFVFLKPPDVKFHPFNLRFLNVGARWKFFGGFNLYSVQERVWCLIRRMFRS